MPRNTELGKIEITPQAITKLVTQLVRECYGVVGLAGRGSGVERLITGNLPHRGVNVRLTDEGVVVDLFVVMQYGVRVSEVAHNLMELVKYSLESSLGIPVAEVNVYVQDLRVSEGPGVP